VSVAAIGARWVAALTAAPWVLDIVVVGLVGVALGLIVRAALPDRTRYLPAIIGVAAILQALANVTDAPVSPSIFATAAPPVLGAILAVAGYVTVLAGGRDRTTADLGPRSAPAAAAAGMFVVAVMALLAHSMGLVIPAPDIAVIAVAIAAMATSSRRAWLGAGAAVLVTDPLNLLESLFTVSGLLLWLIGFGLARLVATIAAGDRGPVRPDGQPHRAIRDLLLVNGLNVVDAVSTWLLLERGTGVELNPVINLIGLPAKIALVAVSSIVLYRVRPQALRWLALPLAAVVAYHAFGIATVGA
jgi:hypothetical protein